MLHAGQHWETLLTLCSQGPWSLFAAGGDSAKPEIDGVREARRILEGMMAAYPAMQTLLASSAHAITLAAQPNSALGVTTTNDTNKRKAAGIAKAAGGGAGGSSAAGSNPAPAPGSAFGSAVTMVFNTPVAFHRLDTKSQTRSPGITYNTDAVATNPASNT